VIRQFKCSFNELKKKPVDIKFSACKTRFWDYLGKQNNLKVFGSKQTKGHKQKSPYLLRSHMSERGEP
jgi:hypothetical protein